MNYFKFILAKIKRYSISDIIFVEIESLVYFIASLIPTVFGVIIRAIFYKIMFKKLSGFPWVQPRVTIVHSDRITCGGYLGINSGTYINGIGGITFGNNVLIGNNVTISSGKHPIKGRLPPIFSRVTEEQRIVIHDDVWIGAGAVIMPGIVLTKGSVIGANAVVTKNTEEYSVNAGVPARKIGDRRSFAN